MRTAISMLIAATLAQSTIPADAPSGTIPADAPPADAPSSDSFYDHLMKFNLVYLSQEEYDFRQTIYNEKDALIKEFNSDPESLSIHAHNQFSTWTQKELEAYNTFRLEQTPEDASFHKHSGTNKPSGSGNSNGISYTINWVTKGGVTPVSNQGQCGSCWTFSTCESLEGANFVATGKLVQLSEQQVVDCSLNLFSNGAGGCNGGNMQTGYTYSKTNPIVPLSDYPYKSGRTQKHGSCKYQKSEGVVGANSYNYVKKNNVAALKNAVEQQPVSISIDASSNYFSSYSSGILNNAQKCGTGLDHAVMIAGWGTQNGVDFWLVKNSWGTSWGEKGYIRFQINSGKGMCGCQEQPLYPTKTFMD